MRAFHPDPWSLSGKQEQFCSTRGVKCAAAIEQAKFHQFSRSDGFLAEPIALWFKNLSLHLLIDSPWPVIIKELLRFFDHGYRRVTNANFSLGKCRTETAHSSDFQKHVVTTLFSL
jgi:hypothetical protein